MRIVKAAVAARAIQGREAMRGTKEIASGCVADGTIRSLQVLAIGRSKDILIGRFGSGRYRLGTGGRVRLGKRSARCPGELDTRDPHGRRHLSRISISDGRHCRRSVDSNL